MIRAQIQQAVVVAFSLATLGIGSPANAFNPPFAWAGEMELVTAPAACGNQDVGDSPRIVFRPKLQAGEANSALSYEFGHAAGIIKKTATSLQFTGSGTYAGTVLSGRAEQKTNAGSFNLTVTPATVIQTTDLISFTGSITNFLAKTGCNVTVRGFAIRRP